MIKTVRKMLILIIIKGKRLKDIQTFLSPTNAPEDEITHQIIAQEHKKAFILKTFKNHASPPRISLIEKNHPTRK